LYDVSIVGNTRVRSYKVSTIVQIDKNYTPLNLSTQEQANTQDTTLEHKLREWSSKALHGRHYNNVNQEQIDKKLSYKFLQAGQLYPETEGFILAIQDQVIATNNYRKFILKDSSIANDKCRKCHQFSETIDHVISGCKILASNEYTSRHNTVAKIIHQAIALQYKVHMDSQPYYTYTPPTIIENKNYKLYWDLAIHTDKTVSHNRPDITFQDKTKNITYLIDISVPSDSNITRKYTEKKRKISTTGNRGRKNMETETSTHHPIYCLSHRYHSILIHQTSHSTQSCTQHTH